MSRWNLTQEEQLSQLMRERRLMRYRDLSMLGLSTKALAKLVKRGAVVKDGNAYRLAEASPTDELQQIAVRFPNAVICLETAQQIHEINDVMAPFTVIALPRSSDRHKRRMPDIPGLKVMTWSDPRLYRMGVGPVDVGGGLSVLCTDRYRTAADMWRPEHRQDVEQAEKALVNINREEGRAGLNKVMQHALVLGWFQEIRRGVSLMAAATEAGYTPRF